jgi:hypothetical protein
MRLVAVSAMVLIPWAAHLADTHPSSVSARHWPLAWTGLDIAMAAGQGATAWLAIRRDRWLAVPAVSTATLLAADAWSGACTAAAGCPLALTLANMCVEREAPEGDSYSASVKAKFSYSCAAKLRGAWN